MNKTRVNTKSRENLLALDNVDQISCLWAKAFGVVLLGPGHHTDDLDDAYSITEAGVLTWRAPLFINKGGKMIVAAPQNFAFSEFEDAFHAVSKGIKKEYRYTKPRAPRVYKDDNRKTIVMPD
jgi:hypothetical protein